MVSATCISVHGSVALDGDVRGSVAAFESVPVLLEASHGVELFHVCHLLFGRVQEKRLMSERQLRGGRGEREGGGREEGEMEEGGREEGGRERRERREGERREGGRGRGGREDHAWH